MCVCRAVHTSTHVHKGPVHTGTHVCTQSCAHTCAYSALSSSRHMCTQYHAHQQMCTQSHAYSTHMCTVPHTPAHVCMQCPTHWHTHVHAGPRTPAHTCARSTVPHRHTRTGPCPVLAAVPLSLWPPHPYSRLGGPRPGHAAQRLATSCGWWYMNIPASVSPMPR